MSQQLAPVRPQTASAATNGSSLVAAALQVTEWHPGQAPRPRTIDEAPYASGLICVVVAVHAKPDEVLRQLRPICGDGLTKEMIDDLMSTDPLPRVRDYRSKETI